MTSGIFDKHFVALFANNFPQTQSSQASFAGTTVGHRTGLKL